MDIEDAEIGGDNAPSALGPECLLHSAVIGSAHAAAQFDFFGV
jgi:hypothetical protein